MKLSTMRKVDYFVGIPLCFLLTLAVRLMAWVAGERAGGAPSTRAGGAVRKILFIELSEMGSTIIASAMIRRVQQRYADAEHCFCIFKKNAASLRLLGLFREENIFTIRDDSLAHMATDVWNFMAFCRRERIDTVIDLELFSRISSLLSLLSGARIRVGFHNYRAEGLYRGEHLTYRVNYNPYHHMSQNFLALVEAMEAPDEIPTPKFAIPPQPPPVRVALEPEAFAYVQNALQQCYPITAQHSIIVVNHDAGSMLPIRTWPRDRFVALIRRLLANDPRRLVVLMGISEAAASARDITAQVGDARCIDFVGRTRTLTDVLQLFHQSDLLITNDSGPAHFATLTRIKSITLFGPETPVLYGTLGEHNVDLFAKLACSPCLSAFNHRHSPCVDNKCLQAISVDQVLGEAERLLAIPSTRVTLPSAVEA